MIQVDLKSRVPLYLQLMQSIKTDIINGNLQADEKLPSVRELSADLIINPNTIQKAFRALEQEGFLYSLPGKGNYVMKLDAAKLKEQQERILKEIVNLIKKAYHLGLTKTDICNYLEWIEKEESND
ncbi:GntR family transcriptional regulator [Clostridiales bacterium COT073_COT-073]|nr:GntR family transcriptional regulator [Clostridiales bacterium COT073_COT-073]